MDAIIVGTFLGVCALIALALFARGGAKEPASIAERSGPVIRMAAGEVEDRVRQMIASLGLSIERVDRDDGRGMGIVAVDRAPVTGQRIYVRTFNLPPGERVSEIDVQTALDAIHGEGLHKAVLVSPNGFSDEAIAAAEDTPAELLDGAALAAVAQARA